MTGSQIELFISRIEDIFKKGFHLTQDSLQFIDSTYGIGNIHDLPDVMDPEHADEVDQDTLFSLIFFPDETVQAEVEPILEASLFTPEDEKIILSRLSEKMQVSQIWYHDEIIYSGILVPEDVLTQFIKRLRITKKQKKDIIHCIEQLGTLHDGLKIKVKLRNARFSFYDNICLFLKDFYKNFPWDHDLFLPGQDFLYEFFTEINEETDILQALQMKIKFFDYQKRKSQQLEDMLRKSNMESMMLAGTRFSGIDISYADAMIDIIRTILLYVYNIIVDIYNNMIDVSTNEVIRRPAS